MRGTLLSTINLLLFFLVLTGSMNLAHGQVLAQDSTALLGILSQNCGSCVLTPNGAQSPWADTLLVGNWAGITVENGRVTKIELPNKGLIGNLAPLDSLDSLKVLDVQNNHLESLPDLGKNRILQSLNCGGNQLTALPDSLGMCTQLEHLSCYINQLTHLPDLSNLSQLTYLNCTQNLLTFPELAPLVSLGIGHLYCDPQNPIPIETVEAIPFLLTDTHTLDAAGIGTSQSQYQWRVDFFTYLNDTTRRLVCDSGSRSGNYSAIIRDPLFPNLRIQTAPVYLEPGPGVRRADTDNNGIVNMLDIVPIGLKYGYTGTTRENPLDTTLQPSLAWRDANGNPQTFQMNSVSHNLNSADVDGNGVLNNEDKFSIDTLYSEPLMLSAYLQNAIQPQFNLRAIPMMNSITLDTTTSPGDTLVHIPYRIEIGDLPNGITSIDLRGVVFTRAVTEPAHLYRVYNIRADFIDSDFIPEGKNAFWLQKYHRNITILPADSNFACLDTLSTHPLDVGVFNTDSVVTLIRSNCIINCIVTLEDVYRPYNQTGLLYDSIPLMLSTINAVVYADSNGQTVPIAGECTTETTYLNLQDLLDDWNDPVLDQQTPLPPPPEDSVKPEPKLHLFPHPVTAGEVVTLEVPLETAGSIYLSLYTSVGQEVHPSLSKVVQGMKGKNQIEIETTGLPKGVYLLKVNCPGNPDSTTMLKLILKN